MPNHRKKWFKRAGWFTLVFVIVNLLFLHFYVPRIITEIRSPISQSSRKAKPDGREKLDDDLFYYKTFDGLNLAATLKKVDSAKGTIILIHGIRGNSNHFKPIMQRLADSGYSSIAIDLRAHGASEGQHTTFGVKEKQDISALLDYLKKQKNITENIGVWGHSLGGAVALQAMAHDKRISYGIVESTFTDFEQIVNDYFENNTGFSSPWLMHYMVQRAGKIADFDPSLADPYNACAKITQPIFMAHGTEDKRISMDYGLKNFENLASNEKQFINIEGANHLNVWSVGGEDYFQKVFSFLAKATSK